MASLNTQGVRSEWDALGRIPFRCEAMSLAITQGIFKKVSTSDHPDIYIRAALGWAERFSAQRPEDIWLAEWVIILRGALCSDQGLAYMYDIMLSQTEHGIDMRQSSPWSGVLSTRERTQIILDFAAAWGSDR